MAPMPRKGVTLIEVLVSIFICALGLISLMALFPVGASTMASANRSNRISNVGTNAAATGVALRLNQDPQAARILSADPIEYLTDFTGKYNIAPYAVNAAILPYITLPNNQTFSRSDVPGVPVFVDPYGLRLGYPPFLANRALAVVQGAITRSAVSFAGSPLDTQYKPRLERWLSLQDSMEFTPEGDPTEKNTALGVPNDSKAVDRVLQREPRFTWAYLLRMPNRQNASLVELTVVVFDRRKAYPPTDPQFGQPETRPEVAYTNVRFDRQVNAVAIAPPTGQPKPLIKAGTWIMDATLIRKEPALGLNIYEPHAFMYRVVNVTDDAATPNGVIAELATKPRMDSFTQSGVPYGVAVVFDNVAEVIERGILP